MKTDTVKLAMHYKAASVTKKKSIIAKVAKALGTDRASAVLYIARFIA